MSEKLHKFRKNRDKFGEKCGNKGKQGILPHLKEHEFVQRIVPLHKEDARRRCTSQIFVSIVRIPSHTAIIRSLSVWDLHTCRAFPRNEFLRNPVDDQINLISEFVVT